MSDIWMITTAGIKNTFRSPIAVIVVLAVVLICAAGLAATFCILFIAPEMKTASPDRGQLEMYLALILFITNLLGLGVNLNAFGFQTLTREKSRGIIQSLLATPLKEKEIWLGKSLAVFLPGLIVGEVLSLVSLLAVNFIYFVPEIGFLLNLWMVLSCFVAAPLMYLSICLLVYLIGLTGKPASGNVIANIFLPALITIAINLVVRSILDAASWSFTLAIFGLAIGIGIISMILQPRLDKERIILSG